MKERVGGEKKKEEQERERRKERRRGRRQEKAQRKGKMGAGRDRQGMYSTVEGEKMTKWCNDGWMGDEVSI